MIEARIEKNGKQWEVWIEGHAEYVKEGPDIVCAAVSILTAVLVQKIRDMELKTYERKEAPGKLEIKIASEKEMEKEIETIMDTIKTGLLLLENKYPKNVRVRGGAKKENMV